MPCAEFYRSSIGVSRMLNPLLTINLQFERKNSFTWIRASDDLTLQVIIPHVY